MATKATIVVLASLFAMVMCHSGKCPHEQPPTDAVYPLVLSIPTGCKRGECSFYVAIRVNEEDEGFLDFIMEGQSTGYIAIGFGKKKSSMLDSDVFACAVAPNTSTVEAFDTYNPPDEYMNIRDVDVNQTTSRNVCPWSANFTSGIISCSFSRAVIVYNFTEDKNLNDFFYIQMAYVNEQPNNGPNGLELTDHGHDHPMITSQTINPFTYMYGSATSLATFSGGLIVALMCLALVLVPLQ